MRSSGADSLLNDKYLPVWHFSEKHSLNIPASQADVMAAVLAYRPDNDSFFRGAIALRELPVRLIDRLQRRATTPRKAFNLDNFTLLERNDNQQLAFGLAGKFWQPDYGQVTVMDTEDFQAFNQPGAAKLVLSYYLEKLDENQTRLTTETRVFCLDKQAQRKFTFYWYLIRPVSGLIRLRMLRSVSKIATEKLFSR